MKLYILPAKHAPLEFDSVAGGLARRTRIYDANGTEFVGIVECSVRMDDDSPTAHRRVSIELRLAHGESSILDAPPESLQDRLAALVASWRAHWAVTNPQGADHESAQLGAGIEKCADELEALMNERRA